MTTSKRAGGYPSKSTTSGWGAALLGPEGDAAVDPEAGPGKKRREEKRREEKAREEKAREEKRREQKGREKQK